MIFGAMSAPIEGPVPRRKRRWVRGLGWIVLTVFFLSVMAAAYQTYAEAEDRRAFAPPGDLIDMGGYDMHLHCTGQGSPTVVLEAGDARTTVTWREVQPSLAFSNRVCSYDRAGYGFSEVSPHGRSPEQIVTELHTLLEIAGEKPPFVMVGHSYGALYSRLYAATYPDQVVGLVLVDPFHEALADDILSWQSSFALGKALAPVGVWRGLAAFGVMPQLEELDRLGHDQDLARIQAMRSSLWHQVHAEHSYIKHIGELLAKAPPLGETPLAVITAGRRAPDEVVPDHAWLSLHYELMLQSDRGIHVMAESSDHFVPQDQPALIANTVRLVVEQLWR